MPCPTDRHYADTHEWHKLDGDIVTLGISKFAADELTDITYVEMREPGTEIEAGDPVGEVESVKATSEVYAAVSGVIAEVNELLADDPGLVNRDAFDNGWLCKIKVADATALDGLMDGAAYDARHPA
ncbi:MAG: glycine cleavage system protein GcvH [Planctomycetes bacterium]|nr:glycine cleavage system protein GcvH [Planctomycetota bacterium]NOG52826.1 glycine cleavage system protein GcvH [Planctomycetota bacterium]